MTSFLYYLPSGADLAKVAHAFEGSPTTRQVTSGPIEKPGHIACQPDTIDAAKIGYYPQRQTWRPVPKTDKEIWVGVDNFSPPTEEKLRRKLQLESKPVTLGGESWRVPIARSFVEIDDGAKVAPVQKLSTYFEINDEGEWTHGEVEKQFEVLWSVGFRYWEHFCNSILAKTEEIKKEDGEDYEPGAILDDYELAEMAIAALQTNYRVGPMECSMLKLIAASSISEILGVVIDLDAYVEISKKKLEDLTPEDQLSDNFGSPEDSEATAQLSQTS